MARRPLDEETWSSPRRRALSEALRFASAEGDDLLPRLLQDLCTHQEIDLLAERWAAVCEVLLNDGRPAGQRLSQARMARDLGVGLSRVNRANDLVNGLDGTGGFVDVYRGTASGETAAMGGPKLDG